VSENNDNGLFLKDFLPYRLSVLSNRVSTAIAKDYSDQFQLSIPEWRVMCILGEEQEISAVDIVERTVMDKVAVSRAVSKLTEKGRVQKHVSDNDKRRSLVKLTDEGLELYQKVLPIARDYERKILARLTEDDQQHLRALLDKLDDIQLHLE
jgi:DNA-binding MarR family transcriptional regulator